MNDLISRQAAIEALEREQSLVERPITETRWFDLGLRKAQDIISELPSAQPERKQGRWVNRSLNILYPESTRYICSVCVKYSYSYDFCPNCGADMRGEVKDE